VRQSLTLLVMGAGTLVYGVAKLPGPEGWITGPIMLTLAGGMIGLGLFVRQSGPAAQAVNVALNLALSGRLAEADELFAQAHARFSIGYIRRVIAVNRAWIALRRGDLEASVAFATEAVTRPVQWLSRSVDQGNVAEARALRAIALASLGDDAHATDDINTILQSPLATPTALARAELARALLLERGGDRAALGAHLAKHRRLLLEYTHPRERAIVRAYQRMLGAHAHSIYRHGATRDPAPRDEPALADWVGKIAPGAAAFVRADAPRGSEPLDRAPAISVSPEVAASAKARFQAPSRAKKGLVVLGLWVVLILMFVAIWQVLAPEQPWHAPIPVPAPVNEPSMLVTMFPWLLPAIFIGVLVFFVKRRRPLDLQLRAAQAALARGDEAAALASFTALAGNPPAVAGPALLALATEQERTGSLQAAEVLCDRGITKSLPIAAAASDFLLPGLFAEHAVILAAQGKRAEATAELALIEERYPAYALLDAARFRISLVDRARHGDFAGAAQIADRSADLPLSVRDELLADLVRVVDGAREGSAAEVDRLRKELRTDLVSRAWIEKVAPAALSAFERVGIEVGAEDLASEAEAEREREAEAEAAAVERGRGWV
jgi:hypothetical protein